MSGLSNAVYSVLFADSTLGALLGTYKTLACVFTVLPDDAPRPYILIPGNTDRVPFDTKNRRGWEYSSDIIVVVDEEGSRKVLGEITDRIVVLLHRPVTLLTVDGSLSFLNEVTGPEQSLSDDSVIVDRLTIRAIT